MGSTDVAKAADIYYAIVFYSSTFAIIALAVTLHHVMKGTRHSFLVLIMMLYVVSNLCAILSNTFARVWIYSQEDKQEDKRVPYMYL
jgi:predicted MFS family arabinose efflux permease